MKLTISSRAKAFGASLAGIASVAFLRNSPSYRTRGEAEWPVQARSVLVLALAHGRTEPELDWWDHKEGGTPGNRRLIETAGRLAQWLREELGINAFPLPYHVRDGGIYLKDAAALAGLGTIGKNNLLITPEFGPCVRLRALFLDKELDPSEPTDFSPCEGCDMPCRRACPQKAFRNGSHSRSLCEAQMREDEANEVILDNQEGDASPVEVVKYCRACELACPLAR